MSLIESYLDTPSALFIDEPEPPKVRQTPPPSPRKIGMPTSSTRLEAILPPKESRSWADRRRTKSSVQLRVNESPKLSRLASLEFSRCLKLRIPSISTLKSEPEEDIEEIEVFDLDNNKDVELYGSIQAYGSNSSDTMVNLLLNSGSSSYSAVGSDEEIANEEKWVMDINEEPLEISHKDLHLSDVVLPHETALQVHRAQMWLTPVHIRHINTDESSFLEYIKSIQYARHSNLVLLVGYTLSPTSLVMELMDQGSLASILENEEIRITHNNVMKVLKSVSKAMAYLHSQTPPIVHGNLTSSSIMLSQGWERVKVTNFGITGKWMNSELPSVRPWEAPSIDMSTKEADIYMFGVITWECLQRKKALDHARRETFEIPKDLRRNERRGTRYVLDIPLYSPPFLDQMMRTCWSNHPSDRPDFPKLSLFFRKMSSWFNDEGDREEKTEWYHRAFEKDYQSLHFHAPRSEMSGELSTSYVRCFSCVTEESSETISSILTPILRTMQKRTTKSGSLVLASSTGVVRNLLKFESIDEVKESDFNARYEGLGVFKKLDSYTSTRCDRLLCEMNDWNVRSGATHCVAQICHVQRVHDHGLPLLRAKPYFCGLVFIYSHDDSVITMYYLVEGKENRTELKRSTILQQIFQMIVEETVTPVFENYVVSSCWSTTKTPLLSKRTRVQSVSIQLAGPFSGCDVNNFSYGVIRASTFWPALFGDFRVDTPSPRCSSSLLTEGLTFSPEPEAYNTMSGAAAQPSVGVADMISLQNLTEESLLENLEVRYNKDIIYTYTGSILVAMNPYQVLSLYSMGTVKQYIGKRLGLLPPHVFATADESFRSMSENSKNQSIIISGESGAGKTETTKLILQFLSARTQGNARTSTVEKKILESSPILEAFGNAKTVRNNNSSRFGKYMEIHFDNTDTIVSARIVQYLLEKSRIVQQAETERNYHVFYQLLCAPQERLDKSKLTQASDYAYLNTSGCITIDNVDDKEDYERMVSAMTTIGFTQAEQDSMFNLLSAVLHIGNLKFKLLTAGKGEASDVANPEEIQIASELLSCDPELLSKSIRQRINFIRGEKFVVPLNLTEAADNRDALAKTIYSTLFAWIVDKINYCITGEGAQRKTKAFIGVLDIFGFENFKINSFEQFCINFTNEKLQQHFNQHIFKLEQEEYKREQIAWADIQFVDNQECIDLIEKKPIGVISLLDEECRFPKGTDLTWLEKMHTNYAKHAFYEKPRTSRDTFIIRHYAGEVSYNVAGFLDKNRDTLQEELMELLYDSKDDFTASLFADIKAEKEAAKKAAASGGGGAKKAGGGKTTAATKFKEQLVSLLQTLTVTHPHYVRCLKPNSQKKPTLWDRDLVLAQLRYAGMMETIRIRKLGFPIRFGFKDFIDRYRVLTSGLKPGEQRDQVHQIIQASKIDTSLIQLGLTKVFMKDGQKSILEDLRNVAVSKAIICIQKNYKGYRARKQFKRLKKSALKGQSLIRRYLARTRYIKTKSAIILAQSLERMRKKRKEYKKQRGGIIMAQKLYRGKKARRQLAKLKEEKRKKEEAQRKEREKIAAERAHLAQQERDELDRQDAEKKEQEQREEQDRIRAEEEAERKKQKEKDTQREEEKRAKAEKDRKAEQEKERNENLEELGLTSDLAELENMVVATGHPIGIPAPPQEERLAQDLTQIDDDDLLDAMMGDHFFGDIPSFVASELDQLAGGVGTFNLNFDFLSAPPPPPADFGGEDDFDSIPPPIATDDLPPPPDFDDLPPPPPPEGGHSPKPSTSAPIVKRPRERPTNVDRVTPKLVTPSSDPPKIINAEQIESYPFKTYAIRMFKDPKKKPKKPSDVYTFSKKPIDGALLASVKGEDAKMAEQIFQKLMMHMGEMKKAAGDTQMNAKFIIAKALSTKTLRDEIYAQICKQTTENPSKESKKRGWEMMAYCVSFFAPSEEMLPFLASYILAEVQTREGEKDIAGYCIRALRRTVQNGTKKVPPSGPEFDAIDKRQPAPIRVKFMDGTDLLLLVDSATTAGEIMQAIITTIKMKDTQGFGLFEVYNNIARKLASSDHVLDAIAKSENLQKQMITRNVKISFNLLFKRSIFLDNKDYYEDLVCRDLIFHQLANDIAEGGFPVTSDVTIRLAALKQVADSKSGRLFDYKKVIAGAQQNEKTDAEWKDSIAKVTATLGTMQPDTAIDEWIALAAHQPMYGALLFTDVVVKDGDGASDMDMSISRLGVTFHERGKIPAKVTYSVRDVKEWTCQDSQTLTIKIQSTMQYISITREGEAYRMAAILKEYVDILQGIGWASTNIDFSSADPDLLSYKKGDIIFIKEKMNEAGWYSAELNKVGAIKEENFDLLVGNPAETGAVILAGAPKRPETNSPSTSKRELLSPTEPGSPDPSSNTLSPNSAHTLSAATLASMSGMTLSPLSTIRFRATKRRTLKADADAKSKMVFSSSPISNSVLDLHSSLNKDAKEAFSLLMKWMGDMPNKMGEKVVTDLIQSGIDHEDLRDEIYTQVVKQTTQNPRRESNVKGWEMLAMLCGTFPASPEVAPMVLYHIANPPSGDEYQKLAERALINQKTVMDKGQRKRAPIPEEVKAIVAGAPVVPRVFSLDGTRKAFKALPHTTFREVNQELCAKYEVSVLSGFGLCEYNSDLDVITPLPEDHYVCDYYNLWTLANKMDTAHKFLFKRRMLAEDPASDLKMAKTHPLLFEFIFHEMLYDLKQGRIIPEMDDLPNLVSLQLQIREGDNDQMVTRQTVMAHLPKNYQQMNIPDDFINRTAMARIEAKGQTPAQCKMSILTILTQKPLYGACIFTNVSVKTVRSTFTKCWLVISRHGVALHDPHEKEPKHFFTHDQITRVASEKDAFTVISGNLMKDDKWVFTGPDVNRAEDVYRLSKQVDAKNNFVPDLY
ncbi:class VII unconventional myosin [Planoprotostelium fungivorum]|uniref:Class VII unconventional myosin n=1 Tax=Planoprotostelium fungivorum TaxID=1890364 RepID=A0A2P6NK47_9EUKA|nr:class VII unconventional myosin [Planoprotostelium fungivorum]